VATFRYPADKAAPASHRQAKQGHPKGNPTPTRAHLTPDPSNQTEHYEETGQKEGSQYESESQVDNRVKQGRDNENHHSQSSTHGCAFLHTRGPVLPRAGET